MGRFTATLQGILNEANARCQNDLNAISTLRRYNGRSITLDLIDDERYVVSILADGLRLETSAGGAVDMYVRTDSEVLSRALRGDFGSFLGKLEAASLLLTGRIQHQNITLDDWNSVKGFIGF